MTAPSPCPFQARVEPWMRECFGDVIPFDREERGDRLLEEVFELLQSGGYDPARVLALRDYVWGRDIGEPAQELGGVMVTLAAYSLAFNLDMEAAGETELARIWTKVPQIRAKQAAKPTGSALPIATASPECGPTGHLDEPIPSNRRAEDTRGGGDQGFLKSQSCGDGTPPILPPAAEPSAVCVIPNCGKRTPAAEPFCADHRDKLERKEP